MDIKKFPALECKNCGKKELEYSGRDLFFNKKTGLEMVELLHNMDVSDMDLFLQKKLSFKEKFDVIFKKDRENKE